MAKLRQRFGPLVAKLSGRAERCPWRSAFALLSPGTLRRIPPVREIEVGEAESGMVRLCFGGKHSFWFPESTPVNQDLWSEYLVVSWESPINFHQYLIPPSVAIEAGDTVFDCGACEGFFTRAALERGAGKVVCIEPSTRLAGCLRKTFAEEIEAGRVVVVEVALGAQPGTANFSDGGIFGGHISADGGVGVKVTTLDQLAALHGHPDFIKMDLEGSEYHALAGGTSVLKESLPKLAVTTYHYEWDYATIAPFVASRGYRSIRPRGVTLRDGTVPRPVMLHAHR